MAVRTPMLIMIQGDRPGRRYELQKGRDTTIGRSGNCDISLVTRSVSRTHCKVSFFNGLWHVEDAGSATGTLLNARKITELEVLKPGDRIRIRTNVLLFDLVDERAEDDDALLGIQEARLDEELDVKGPTELSLEGIRRRSRLSVQAVDEEEETEAGLPVGLNVAFVVVCAVVIAAAAGGALAFGRMRAAQEQSEVPDRAQIVRSEYAKAVGLLEQGAENRAEALNALRSVAEKYPGTEEALMAEERCQELEWEHADAVLAGLPALEAARKYGEAISACREAAQLATDQQLKDLLEETESFLQRLAGAALRDVDERAVRLLEEEKDPDSALALYRELAEDIPEGPVAEDIERRMADIQERRGADDGE